MDPLLLSVGIGLIAVGLLAKGNFYWSGYLTHPNRSGIRIPPWLGRALFIGAGIAVIYQAFS